MENVYNFKKKLKQISFFQKLIIRFANVETDPRLQLESNNRKKKKKKKKKSKLLSKWSLAITANVATSQNCKTKQKKEAGVPM
jgi:hypothetical protein